MTFKDALAEINRRFGGDVFAYAKAKLPILGNAPVIIVLPRDRFKKTHMLKILDGNEIGDLLALCAIVHNQGYRSVYALLPEDATQWIAVVAPGQ